MNSLYTRNDLPSVEEEDYQPRLFDVILLLAVLLAVVVFPLVVAGTVVWCLVEALV